MLNKVDVIGIGCFIGISLAVVLLLVILQSSGTSTTRSWDEIDAECEAKDGFQLHNRNGSPTICIRNSAIIQIDRNRK